MHPFRFLLLSYHIVLLFALNACSDQEQQKQQLLLKGNQALEIQDYEQAIFYFQQAAKMDSCFASAYNNIGTVYLRTGRPEIALTWYDSAVACSPSGEFLLNRANAHLENKSWNLALADVDRTLQLHPDTVPALALKGVVLSSARRFDEALAVLDRAIAVAPGQPDNWVNRGVVRYQQHDFPAARNDLRTALRLDSTHADAKNTLSMVLTELGQPDSALVLVNQALAVRPRHPYYLNNRGWIELVRGNWNNARRDIDNSLAIDPSNAWAMRNSGILLLQNKDAKGAETLFRKAWQADSTADRVGWLLGVALVRQDKRGEGCRWLTGFTGDSLLGFQNPCR